MSILAEKGRRLSDMATFLSRHAAGPRSWTALLSAYGSTLHSTTSKEELEFSLRIKSEVYPFRMRQSDIFVLEEILLQRQYELCAPLKQEPVIIDAGANIGVAALWLLASHPRATLHAFEPEPENFRLLHGNIAALDRVFLQQQAVGASVSTLTLHVADHGALHSIKAAAGNSRTAVPVECIRLDGYLDAKGIDRVDLLKVDVEGSEMDLLLGLGDRLDAVQAIVGEMHETLVDEGEFYRFLGDHGFRRLRKTYYGTGRDQGVHVFEMAR